MNVKAIEGSGLELDVLGLPYGGPHEGRDAQGEYFAPDTQTHEDKWPLPPVVYYHGYGDDGRPAGSPAYIGRTVKRWRDAAGEWFRVVLDDASDLARRVFEAARRGAAHASTGAPSHLVRKDTDGHIREWPVAELSVFETDTGKLPANTYAVALPVHKAVYTAAGLSLPLDIEATPEAAPEAGQPAAKAETQGNIVTDSNSGASEMEEEKIQALVNDGVAKALEAWEKRQAEKAAAVKAQEEHDAEVIKAARAKWEEEIKAAGRLPYMEGQAPYVTKFNDRKYDNLDAADMAFMIGTLKAAQRKGHSQNGVSEEAYKSLALKAMSQRDAELKAGPRDVSFDCRPAMKAMQELEWSAQRPLKSDEIMQQDLSNYGDQWVGVFYSNSLWDAIRAGTFVVERLPKMEVPAGHESVKIPLESTDPTWYKVAEATSITDTTTGIPDVTVTASQMGTGQATLSLAKMGARVLWSGELEEDSLIPFVPQLRAQMVKSGAETLEHVVIDGDTTTSAETNINDIAGTPAGTEAFLLVDGFRKLPLVTNTANARSAGALTEDDYLETVKLLGPGGLHAADITKVTCIVDPSTYWKSLALASLKTQDVFRNATLESGQLRRVYGYEVVPSWNMNKTSAVRLSRAADGKIDLDTTTNNVAGTILAVRWDQWLFGWRRRMTMETERIARADTTEIVALMRFGLVYRDTEAAAASYGVTV